jgi:hypothetical protein
MSLTTDRALRHKEYNMHNSNNNISYTDAHLNALARVKGPHKRTSAAAAIAAVIRGDEEAHAHEIAREARRALAEFLAAHDESDKDDAVDRVLGMCVGLEVVQRMNDRAAWEEILGHVEADMMPLLEAAAMQQFGANAEEATRAAARATLALIIIGGICGDDFTILPLSSSDVLDGLYADTRENSDFNWGTFYARAGSFPAATEPAPTLGWREVCVDDRARVTLDLEKLELYVYVNNRAHYSLCVRIDDTGTIMVEKACAPHAETAVRALEKCIPGARVALCL